MKDLFLVEIDATQAHTHRLKVSIRAKNGKLPLLLQFPVWTPGSYLVREYSRHITRFQGGEKLNKHCWRVNNTSSAINYEVYAFEKTVRTSYLDAHYATLVGATLLPQLPGQIEVTLKFPRHWTLCATGLLKQKAGPGTWKLKARDFDHWVDSPIIASDKFHGATINYAVNGIKHELAWVGSECGRPLNQVAKDFAKINATIIKIFGSAPFKKYTTLLHLGHKLYGGLEHRDSQLSQFDGASIAENKDYQDLLRLYAHEYFHSWNVKSVRPEALGPFDYSRENYTQELWFAEGLTDYFDEMIPFLAGITDKTFFWKARLKGIAQTADGLPGHSRRSLVEASFDAWIRAYRPDEDSPNTDVSYYSKGSMLGLCWDAFLQKKSRGRWNLAKLMKEIYKEFGITADEPLALAKPGYTRAEIFKFAEAKTKIKQADLIESWVKKRAPLPWREALAHFKVKYGVKVTDNAKHFLGIQIANATGAVAIKTVYSESNAQEATLAAGDDVLAINGDRCTDTESFNNVFKRNRAKQKSLKFTISRNGRLREISVRPTPHAGLGQELEYLPWAQDLIVSYFWCSTVSESAPCPMLQNLVTLWITIPLPIVRAPWVDLNFLIYKNLG